MGGKGTNIIKQQPANIKAIHNRATKKHNNNLKKFIKRAAAEGHAMNSPFGSLIIRWSFLHWKYSLLFECLSADCLSLPASG
jgi:hypothetical protein